MRKAPILFLALLASQDIFAKEVIKKVTGNDLALVCVDDLEKRKGDKIEIYSSDESGNPVKIGSREALKVGDVLQFYKSDESKRIKKDKSVIATAEVTSIKDDCVTAKGDLEFVHPDLDVRKVR